MQSRSLERTCAKMLLSSPTGARSSASYESGYSHCERKQQELCKVNARHAEGW